MRSALRLRRPRALAALAGAAALVVTALAMTAGQATAASPAPCRTSELRVWRADPGSGAAGSTYYELQLSNVSARTCSLRGYPGVSAIAGSGRQLGAPAARDQRFAPSTVVLAPGATSHAVLRLTDVANLPRSVCQPTTAVALRIYPPNQSTSTLLPFRFAACASAARTYLTVRTVRPQAGIPGYSQ